MMLITLILGLFAAAVAVAAVGAVLFMRQLRSRPPRPTSDSASAFNSASASASASAAAEALYTDPDARAKDEALIRQPFAEFAKSSDSQQFDAICIGSGMGGLTTASYLARAGKRVLVLEQHDVAGGCTHVYEDKGFEFDTGLHYIGEMADGPRRSTTRQMFDTISDGKLQWATMGNVYDRFILSKDAFATKQNNKVAADTIPTTGTSTATSTPTSDQSNGSKPFQFEERFDFVADRQNLRAALVKRYPNDEAAIDKYFRAVRGATNEIGPFVLTKLLPEWALMLLTLIFPKAGFASRDDIYSQRTTASVLAEIFPRNVEIRHLLTYIWGDYGTPPSESPFAIHAVVAAHYFRGAFYPVGGSSELAKTIVAALEKRGSKVLVRAPVESILLDASGTRAVGVRMAKGQELFAPLIISAAGAMNTYTKLIPVEHRAVISKQLGELQSGKRVATSTGHVYAFIGLDASPQELGFTAANYWVSPQLDHDAAYSEFIKNPKNPFAGVFISFPSAKDPTWNVRFPSKAVALVVTPAPFEWFEAYQSERVKHRGDEYQNLKQELGDRMMDAFYHFFPQAKEHVQYVDFATPVTNNHYLGATRGESYGLDFRTGRFDTRGAASWLTPKTPISGLYLSGQDAFINGVVGAMMGGFICACAISPKIAWDNLYLFNKGK